MNDVCVVAAQVQNERQHSPQVVTDLAQFEFETPRPQVEVDVIEGQQVRLIVVVLEVVLVVECVRRVDTVDAVATEACIVDEPGRRLER